MLFSELWFDVLDAVLHLWFGQLQRQFDQADRDAYFIVIRKEATQFAQVCRLWRGYILRRVTMGPVDATPGPLSGITIHAKQAAFVSQQHRTLQELLKIFSTTPELSYVETGYLLAPPSAAPSFGILLEALRRYSPRISYLHLIISRGSGRSSHTPSPTAYPSRLQFLTTLSLFLTCHAHIETFAQIDLPALHHLLVEVDPQAFVFNTIQAALIPRHGALLQSLSINIQSSFSIMRILPESILSMPKLELLRLSNNILLAGTRDGGLDLAIPPTLRTYHAVIRGEWFQTMESENIQWLIRSPVERKGHPPQIRTCRFNRTWKDVSDELMGMVDKVVAVVTLLTKFTAAGVRLEDITGRSAKESGARHLMGAL